MHPIMHKIRVVNPENQTSLETDAIIDLKTRGLLLPNELIERLCLRRSEFYYKPYNLRESREEAKSAAESQGESYYGQALVQIDGKEGQTAVRLEDKISRPTVGRDVLEKLGIMPKNPSGYLVTLGFVLVIAMLFTGAILWTLIENPETEGHFEPKAGYYPSRGAPLREAPVPGNDEMVWRVYPREQGFLDYLGLVVPVGVAIGAFIGFVYVIWQYYDEKKKWEGILHRWRNRN